MKYWYSLFLFVFVFAAVGCKKFDPKEQADLDAAIIADFLATNFLTAESSESGLHWIIDSLGSGANPDLSSEVTVAYSGYFTDGTVFDESSDSGATFPLTGVIEGWQEGIPKFKKGGGGVLLIPSALGYGNNEVGAIPKNSVLIFEVRLIDFQ
jgi:FKBP-type peptidyl-prolyl cis-trans isomerase FkpA